MSDTATSEATEAPNVNKTRKRVLQGTVRSDKMDKTVVVEVTHRVRHKTYKKYVLRRERYMVHDERNEFKTGDVVRIVESRPYSRHKRWRAQSLVERPQ